MFKKAYLEISNVCNLSCAFCPGNARAPHFMTEAEFRTAAEKLRPYSDYLYFHLMGEPLLHPLLGRFLEIAQELGFRVILTTNATLLAKTQELLLNAPGLHKVNISLQSFEANKETGPLQDYLSSCISFAKAAAEKDKICVFRLWNRNGLDTRNSEIEEQLKESFASPWEEQRRGIRLQNRVWLEYGEKFDWPDLSSDRDRETGFCYGLRDQIGVLCDGTVVPCCLDGGGEIRLGNIFQQDMQEILQSERARRLYDGFSQRRIVEKLCRTCGYAARFD